MLNVTLEVHTIKVQKRKYRLISKETAIIIVVVFSVIIFAILTSLYICKRRRKKNCKTKSDRPALDPSSGTLPRGDDIPTESYFSYCADPIDSINKSIYDVCNRNLTNRALYPWGGVTTRNEYNCSPAKLNYNRYQISENQENFPYLVTPKSEKDLINCRSTYKPITTSNFDPLYTNDTYITISGLSSECIEEIPDDKLLSPSYSKDRTSMPLDNVKSKNGTGKIQEFKTTSTETERDLSVDSRSETNKEPKQSSGFQHQNGLEDAYLLYNTHLAQPCKSVFHQEKSQLMYAEIYDGTDKLYKIDSINSNFYKNHKNNKYAIHDIKYCNNLIHTGRNSPERKLSYATPFCDVIVESDNNIISQLSKELHVITSKIKNIEEKICKRTIDVRDIYTQNSTDKNDQPSFHRNNSIRTQGLDIFSQQSKPIKTMTYHYIDTSMGIEGAVNNSDAILKKKDVTAATFRRYKNATLPPCSRFSILGTPENYNSNISLGKESVDLIQPIYDYHILSSQLLSDYDQERKNRTYFYRNTSTQNLYSNLNLSQDTVPGKKYNVELTNYQRPDKLYKSNEDSCLSNHYLRSNKETGREYTPEDNINANVDNISEQTLPYENISEKKDSSKPELFTESEHSTDARITRPRKQSNKRNHNIIGDNNYSLRIPVKESDTDFDDSNINWDSVESKPPHYFPECRKYQANICAGKNVNTKSKVNHTTLKQLENNILTLKRTIEDFVTQRTRTKKCIKSCTKRH